MLPVLTYTSPEAAANALRSRDLQPALQRAAQLGKRGAAFPWRTIAGQECSAYWPAGTAAFHINADIADAVIRYVRATGDEEFERTVDLDLLVHAAGYGAAWDTTTGRAGCSIDGVTGPDEYSAVADNNVYTNLMAQQNLRVAADAATATPERAREAGAATRRKRRNGATPPRPCTCPTTTRWASTRRPRYSPPPGMGLRSHRARAVPVAAALPLLRPLPPPGRRTGRPGAGDAPAMRRLHRRPEGAEISTTTNGLPSGTPLCPRAPRQ